MKWIGIVIVIVLVFLLLTLAVTTSNNTQKDPPPILSNIELPSVPIETQTGGACWVYAPLAAIEITLLANTGQTTQLSRNQVLHCLGTPVPENPNRFQGKSVHVLEYATKYELFTEAQWTNMSVNQASQATCYQSTSTPLLSGYGTIAASSPNFEQQLYQLLLDGICPIVHLNGASSPFFKHLTQFEAHLSTNDPLEAQASFQHVHAVCLVGVQNGYWVLRNSWSISWGNHDYFYIPIGSNLMSMLDHPAYYPILKTS
jgi:C1A family cysteine protease